MNGKTSSLLALAILALVAVWMYSCSLDVRQRELEQQMEKWRQPVDARTKGVEYGTRKEVVDF